VCAGLEHYADTGQLSEEELERMYARADVDHDGQVRGSTIASPSIVGRPSDSPVWRRSRFLLYASKSVTCMTLLK
jgi:hypothetical protein